MHMENTSRGSCPSTQDPRSTVKHYSLNLAHAGNLARAGKFFRAGRTFRANRTFRATPLGLREPPNCPLRLRETPYTTPSGLPPAISEHTASQLPFKGGYPQLQGRGYHPSPGRPETLASHTWALAAVTGTFHTLLSVYLRFDFILFNVLRPLFCALTLG